jgi:hypothetical protein
MLMADPITARRWSLGMITQDGKIYKKLLS